jgi:hypothetical protein
MVIVMAHACAKLSFEYNQGLRRSQRLSTFSAITLELAVEVLIPGQSKRKDKNLLYYRLWVGLGIAGISSQGMNLFITSREVRSRSEMAFSLPSLLAERERIISWKTHKA